MSKPKRKPQFQFSIFKTKNNNNLKLKTKTETAVSGGRKPKTGFSRLAVANTAVTRVVYAILLM